MKILKPIILGSLLISGAALADNATIRAMSSSITLSTSGVIDNPSVIYDRVPSFIIHNYNNFPVNVRFSIKDVSSRGSGSSANHNLLLPPSNVQIPGNSSYAQSTEEFTTSTPAGGLGGGFGPISGGLDFTTGGGLVECDNELLNSFNNFYGASARFIFRALNRTDASSANAVCTSTNFSLQASWANTNQLALTGALRAVIPLKFEVQDFYRQNSATSDNFNAFVENSLRDIDNQDFTPICC